ncbi:hypoxanthine-guanine phosphoribosyltransferase [Arenimonas sp. GDDSR-1]|uniref:hypoxanthine-guanine phosphoribosyltransferase n=1 Tax=Arenimonas sp. GDDSR-1 TaxID=2950125 RepID=UPI002630DBE1|nr:hypoxanthine-guanine phosphoribosyltransferase [Arenimonas sp. GDDSR-1]
MMRHDIEEVLARSERLQDRTEIEQAIDRMAGQIRKDLHGQFPVFLTLMHGGLFFAARLGLSLNMDAEFDYLHATRYRGETTGSGLAWLHRPAAVLEGRTVLLVDDILDEGHTLKAVRDWCEDQGAARVKIAVMAIKQHDRCVPGLEADYSGFSVPDRYVFGYGMDINEHGRNLPGIYALI